MRFVSGMAVATMLVGVLSAATTSPARAASSYSYGKYWAAATSADNERLETGPAARAFGDAMSAVGYANTTDLDGETANQGWLNGANAQVFGFFGHADFDRLALDDPAPGSSDPNTIQWHWANLSTWEVDLAPNVRSWEEYQPGLADDMKFAILGGCHTAANPDDGNSWFLILRLIGVDNVAGFSDFVFGPTVEGDPSSGNYYWTRFSDYARNGYTLRDALSLARADLFAAEGNNWGFDSWAVGGANDDPGAARFTPAEAGAPNVAGTGSVIAPVTSVPTSALDLGGLTVTRSRSTTVDGQRVIDRETAEGVTYRLDGAGDLTALQAPASREGPVTVDSQAAIDAARAFAEDHVAWFDAGAFTVTRTAPVSHGRGERALAIELRRITGGDGAGAAAVRAEVDERTGSVTLFSAARAGDDAQPPAISQDAAVAAARSALGTSRAPAAVTADWWHGPRFTVRFDETPSAASTERRSVAVVDGRTGAVTATATTA